MSSSGTASRRGGKSSAGGRSPVSILLITSCETVAWAARSFWAGYVASEGAHVFQFHFGALDEAIDEVARFFKRCLS